MTIWIRAGFNNSRKKKISWIEAEGELPEKKGSVARAKQPCDNLPACRKNHENNNHQEISDIVNKRAVPNGGEEKHQ